MAAAQTAPSYQLRTGSGIEPLHQGAFDTFSGVYAIINALRLIEVDGRRLTPMEHRWLYERGIEQLQRYQHMAYALSWGVTLTLWRRLLVRLVDDAASYLGCDIHIHHPFRPRSGAPRDAVFLAIDKALRSENPVLINLAGKYDHYTVVSGCSATRLTLFDSSGRRTILKSLCGMSDDPNVYRHRILAGSLHILEAAA